MATSSVPSNSLLLALGPARLDAWLNAQGRVPGSGEGVHWQGLAESAARRARAELSLEWARVALRLYAHWSDLMEDDGVRESARLSAMFLQAWLIRNLGAEEGDPVLDLAALACRFEEGLTLSVADARREAAVWQALDLDRVRTLRRIKDRLKPFELLPAGLLDDIPRVRAWLAIRAELP